MATFKIFHLNPVHYQHLPCRFSLTLVHWLRGPKYHPWLRQLATFNNPGTVKLLGSPGKAGGLPNGNYGTSIQQTSPLKIVYNLMRISTDFPQMIIHAKKIRAMALINTLLKQLVATWAEIWMRCSCLGISYPCIHGHDLRQGIRNQLGQTPQILTGYFVCFNRVSPNTFCTGPDHMLLITIRKKQDSVNEPKRLSNNPATV